MIECCVGYCVRVDVGYGLDEVFVGLLVGCRVVGLVWMEGFRVWLIVC